MPRSDTHYQTDNTTQHDPRAKVAVYDDSYSHNAKAVSFIPTVPGDWLALTPHVQAALDAIGVTIGALGDLAFQFSPLSIGLGGTSAISKTAAFNNLSPTTTVGDLIYRGTLDNVRLAGNITTTRKYLSQIGDGAAAGAPTWETISGTGDVVGPASSTDNAIVRFDGTTGKLIQNSVVTIDDVGNLANAAHNHQNAAGGGQLSPAAIVMSGVNKVPGSTGGSTTATNVTWTQEARDFLALGAGTDRQVLRWLNGLASWATLELADLPIPFLDTQAIISGSADITKLIRFEADGITTGTTRVITMADQNVSLVPGTGTFAPGTSGLATGIIKSTTGTGVLSIAVGADLPSHVHSAADVTSGILALARGGTGSDLSATGGSNKVLMQLSAGAAVTVFQLAASQLSDGTTGSNRVVLATAPTIVSPVFSAGFVLDSDQQIAWLDGDTGFQINLGITSVASSSKTIDLPNLSGVVALINAATLQSWSGPQSFSGTMTFATGSAPSFGDHITMNGAFNIKTTSAGTKIGAQLGCKLAFYTATPVIQQLASVEIRALLKVMGLIQNTATAADCNLEGGALLNIASIDTNGATTLVFKVNTGTEMTLDVNALTFEAGATDVGLGWATSGQLDFTVASAIEMSLAANTLTFEAGAVDVGLGFGTSGQLDFRIGSNPMLWVTDVSSGGALTFKGNAGTDSTIRTNASALLFFSGATQTLGLADGLASFPGTIGLTAIAAPTAAQGSIWFDSTQRSHSVSEVNNVPSRRQYISRAKAVQTASVTVADTTTAETTLLSVTGDLTLDGGTTAGTRALEIGRTIRVTACGIITTSATPEPFNLRVKYGTTVLCSTGDITPTLSLTNRLWWLDAIITVRTVGAAGTVFSQGKLLIYTGAAATMPYELVTTAAVNIDTETDSALGFTVDYTNAIAGTNTTIVLTNWAFEILM